ncbi:hypothetical protein CgunFtcFv8_021611 [Champsocephalus gunnari]|uniref:Uncharacterized protein n=1 Tax=Champsocephalus gunnari TaxID=52237 RepID=A0AAN8HWN0_CHAGU|nr:hypothetical protein CgunFtcFv8_021611 [Champsocephalus gunnari]
MVVFFTLAPQYFSLLSVLTGKEIDARLGGPALYESREALCSESSQPITAPRGWKGDAGGQSACEPGAKAPAPLRMERVSHDAEGTFVSES